MAPPDEPTAEEELLERLESPPCQHRVADPGGLPEVTLDGSRADSGVDVVECRRDDRGDLGRRGGRHPALRPVEPTHEAADDVPLPPERLRRRHVGAERHWPRGLPHRRDEMPDAVGDELVHHGDRKSTRLNSSHLVISYAVFCLKKKKKEINSLEPCHIAGMMIRARC